MLEIEYYMKLKKGVGWREENYVGNNEHKQQPSVFKN
jgi:hypothetical protein